jgi:peptidyl-prolyl cis-trans isomerase A (cyclophilin A)
MKFYVTALALVFTIFSTGYPALAQQGDAAKDTPAKSEPAKAEASKTEAPATDAAKATAPEPAKKADSNQPDYLLTPRKVRNSKDWEKTIFNGVKRFYAILHVKVGDKKLPNIKIKLFHTAAPETVKNFIGLSEGLKTWFSNGRSMINKPMYRNMKFHRVIRGFMIQTGDPLGDGTGGPGYQFKDEFTTNLRHDRKGIVSMANAGPGTNGSQFFITVAPARHLDDRHSIFGEVVSGYRTVEKISRARTDRLDRPRKDIILEKITIIRER